MKAVQELGFKKIFGFTGEVLFRFLFSLAILPPLRSFLLKILGSKIGKDSVVLGIKLFNVYNKGFKNLQIGENCFLGEETMLDMASEIILEDHVTLAERVLVLTHLNVGYRGHPLQKYFPREDKKVIFERGCFVGAGAIILPGICVGRESFVAAGSVVADDVEPRVLAGGVPAKKIREIK